MLKLNVNDTFSKELPADKILENTRRQVEGACFSYAKPRIPSNPEMVHVSNEMLEELGLSQDDKSSLAFLDVFSGKAVYEGTEPYAMCYGGHQFGHWAGQLGDGRAINLMEVTHNDKMWSLQLKGAGETPYSRTADGLAVLRSSVREHLCSEAMFHLGVPTTRSLSLALSGDKVLRDMMYDGNADYEKGAIVCRVSPSFVRFGNFQIFASRNDSESLKKLADYTIKHHYPEVKSTGTQAYIDFFEHVSERTAQMVLEWQRVGFVHGVMNTDNMSILGLTIDYGPYGWLEGYDKNWTPNTTDKQNRRYRFGNQAAIAHWNLYQLANALMLIINDPVPLEKSLKQFQISFIDDLMKMKKSKLGLKTVDANDLVLVNNLEKILELVETDMTIFYRNLSNVTKSDTPKSALDKVKDCFYVDVNKDPDILKAWHTWMQVYVTRLSSEETSAQDRKNVMDKINPKYVLRNYMAQLAIDAADNGDYSIIEELYQLLKAPYDEQIASENWFAKRPEWARNKVGCSMLSCSS